MQLFRFNILMAALATVFLAGCGLRPTFRPVAGNTPSFPTAAPAPRSRPTNIPVRSIGAGAEGVKTRKPLPRRVLALYYPWYQTADRSNTWAHQEGVDTAHKRILSHAHYPVSGPYDSSDLRVMERHLAQAQAAGIDTLVCSWWGADDPTDETIRALLPRAAKHHITICALWEQYKGMGGDEELSRNLTYLLQGMARQPGYLKVDNRPVVFVYERVRLSARHDEWVSVLNEITNTYPPGVFIVGDGQTHEERLMWDGQYSLHAPDSMVGQTPEAIGREQHHERLADLTESHRQNHVAVVSLMPGYDDRRYNTLHNQPGSVLVNRENGELYATLWKQAIKDKPDWILINSFNQWHAGNEIEPSVEMGDRYLKLTRMYADRFKQ